MVSIVSLLGNIKGQGKLWVTSQDLSTTIAAGARSPDTSITGIPYNKIIILGITTSSEANTNWRIKFYAKDSFDGTTYATNTYIGDLELSSPSVNAAAAPSYEASVESSMYYWDQDLTNEIHFIIENIGQVTSKVLVKILYAESE